MLPSDLLPMNPDFSVTHVPGPNRLAGKYSIRINDQWRLVLRWTDGDAYEVQIVDYH